MPSFEALIVTAQSYNHHQDRMEIVREVAISIVGEKRVWRGDWAQRVSHNYCEGAF